MNENKLNITIQLDGKKFPMQIADDEQTEIVYRQAAEKVNELILKYKTNYELSKDDILSMVAFHTTVNYLLLKKDRKEDTVEIAKDLQEINHLLDVYLADKEVL
jgi:cell division protein ZapA (FtsZ GTPase activity inhibitor)